MASPDHLRSTQALVQELTKIRRTTDDNLRLAALAIFYGRHEAARNALRAFEAALPALKERLNREADEDWSRRIDDAAELTRAHGKETSGVDYGDECRRLASMSEALRLSLPSTDRPDADAIAADVEKLLADPVTDVVAAAERLRVVTIGIDPSILPDVLRDLWTRLGPKLSNAMRCEMERRPGAARPPAPAGNHRLWTLYNLPAPCLDPLRTLTFDQLIDRAAARENRQSNAQFDRLLGAMGVWLSPIAIKDDEKLAARLAEHGGLLARIAWTDDQQARKEQVIVLCRGDGGRTIALDPSLPHETWLSFSEIETLGATFRATTTDPDRLRRWLGA